MIDKDGLTAVLNYAGIASFVNKCSSQSPNFVHQTHILYCAFIGYCCCWLLLIGLKELWSELFSSFSVRSDFP